MKLEGKHPRPLPLPALLPSTPPVEEFLGERGRAGGSLHPALKGAVNESSRDSVPSLH